MSDFGLNLENHYAQLPDDFYTRMPAEKVGTAPCLIHANPAAAALLDLDPAGVPLARASAVEAAGHVAELDWKAPFDGVSFGKIK